MKNNTPYRLSPLGPLKTPSSGVNSPKAQATNKANDSDDSAPKWYHLTLEFLKPENIMDMRRRRPDHPEYDPKTLYVPLSFKEKCTPVSKTSASESCPRPIHNVSIFLQAVRQWWEMKEQNYDTILFFKLGKFYELYNMDAVVGCQELGIDFMRVCCPFNFCMMCKCYMCY